MLCGRSGDEVLTAGTAGRCVLNWKILDKGSEWERGPPALEALLNVLRERRTASFEAYSGQLDLFRAMARDEMPRVDFAEVGRLCAADLRRRRRGHPVFLLTGGT